MKNFIKKRMIAALLAVVMTAGLTACGSSDLTEKEDTTGTTVTQTEATTETTVLTTETTETTKTTVAAVTTAPTTMPTTAPVDVIVQYLVDVQALKTIAASADFALEVDSVTFENGKATITVTNRSAEDFKTMTLYAVAYNDFCEPTWVNSSAMSVTQISSLVPIMSGEFAVGETRKISVSCDPKNTTEVQVIVAQYKTKAETVVKNPIAQDWTNAAFVPNPEY